MNDDKYRYKKERPFKYYCEFPFHAFWKNFDMSGPFNPRKRFYRNIFHTLSSGTEIPVIYHEDIENGLILSIEIPGISKEEIELEVTPDELWLRAKNEELKKSYSYHDYFDKSINSEEVEAHLKAGILTIKVFYSDKSNKTRVKIN